MMQNLPFEPEFEQAYKGMSLLIFPFLISIPYRPYHTIFPDSIPLPIGIFPAFGSTGGIISG
jgi:hypothetical protein